MTCLPIEKIPHQEQTKQKRQKYSFPFIWIHGYYRPHWTNISLSFRLRGIVGTGCTIFWQRNLFYPGKNTFSSIDEFIKAQKQNQRVFRKYEDDTLL